MESDPVSKTTTCEACDGSGQVDPMLSATDPANGPCETCSGVGAVYQTTAILLEIARLARELVATADLSEPRGMTTTVSSDHLAELMEALEDAETHG